MPNYCASDMIIRGSEKELKRLLDTVQTEQFNFDFNSLISLKETLSLTDKKKFHEKAKEFYIAYYGSKKKQMAYFKTDLDDELHQKLHKIFTTSGTRKQADIYRQSLKKIVLNDFFDWQNYYWGTKWNPNHADISSITVSSINPSMFELHIFFNTAWTFPKPIFHYLANEFPYLNFTISVDEEAGFFYGDISLSHGVYKEKIKEGKRPN